MIIGFGFGSPLTAILMLLVTGFISYMLFNGLRRTRNRQSTWGQVDDDNDRKHRKEFYYEQRRRAHQLMQEYDLSDEEIEKRVEEEMRDGK